MSLFINLFINYSNQCKYLLG